MTFADAVPVPVRIAPLPTAMVPAPTLVPLKRNVPLLMTKLPARLLSPLRVRMPAPPVTREPPNASVPANVTSLLSCRLALPETNVAPAKLRAPLFTASPRASVPERSAVLDSVLAMVESLESRPPENNNVPVPSAASLPN